MQSLNDVLSKMWVFRTPGNLSHIELGYFSSYEEAENELKQQYSEWYSPDYTYNDGTMYEIYTVEK